MHVTASYHIYGCLRALFRIVRERDASRTKWATGATKAVYHTISIGININSLGVCTWFGAFLFRMAYGIQGGSRLPFLAKKVWRGGTGEGTGRKDTTYNAVFMS